ncbi:MAG: hypothetical protein HQM16_18425 [Deltaproteobacteria bacterium]|nr:hypothetical protein [Deltaproteobacteria bacterium]
MTALIEQNVQFKDKSNQKKYDSENFRKTEKKIGTRSEPQKNVEPDFFKKNWVTRENHDSKKNLNSSGVKTRHTEHGTER